jgi:hypothetical protein
LQQSGNTDPLSISCPSKPASILPGKAKSEALQ